MRVDLTSWPEVATRTAGGVRRIPGAVHGPASRVSQQLESFRQPRVTRFSSREMQCASHGRARRGPVLFLGRISRLMRAHAILKECSQIAFSTAMRRCKGRDARASVPGWNVMPATDG